jgi:hypothetical protein
MAKNKRIIQALRSDPRALVWQIKSCIASINGNKRALAYNLEHGGSIDSYYCRNCTESIARTEGFLAEHMANLTAVGYSSVEDFLTKYKALKSAQGKTPLF